MRTIFFMGAETQVSWTISAINTVHFYANKKWFATCKIVNAPQTPEHILSTVGLRLLFASWNLDFPQSLVTKE